MISRCTSDHRVYRTLSESTCRSSHRRQTGPLCHLITHLDIRACPLLWALLSRRGIQLGLSCMSCKVRGPPGLCRCLLASQGIMLAPFIIVMKTYLHLESKKQKKKKFIFPNYNLWGQLRTYLFLLWALWFWRHEWIWQNVNNSFLEYRNKEMQVIMCQHYVALP